jgi:hypothetical protein
MDILFYKDKAMLYKGTKIVCRDWGHAMYNKEWMSYEL